METQPELVAQHYTAAGCVEHVTWFCLGALPAAHQHAEAGIALYTPDQRRAPAVHEQAEATVALSTEQRFPLWVALGTILHGWALAMQGRGKKGMAQVHEGIAAWRATGAAQHVSYYCTMLAEVYYRLGHTEDGLQALTEAHTLVEQHEERHWETEVSRLRGVLLLRPVMTCLREFTTWESITNCTFVYFGLL